MKFRDLHRILPWGVKPLAPRVPCNISPLSSTIVVNGAGGLPFSSTNQMGWAMCMGLWQSMVMMISSSLDPILAMNLAILLRASRPPGTARAPPLPFSGSQKSSWGSMISSTFLCIVFAPCSGLRNNWSGVLLQILLRLLNTVDIMYGFIVIKDII